MSIWPRAPKNLILPSTCSRQLGLRQKVCAPMVSSSLLHDGHHRGIFHTKDETLSTSGYHRLHILCGESLCSHTAMWLRTATTAAIVALSEGGIPLGHEVAPCSPLEAIRVFAADPECRARVRTADGSRMSALEIQRHYLGRVEAHMHNGFMPPWTPDACRKWREILDCIEQGAQACNARLDWAIKRELYAQHARRHGVEGGALPGRTLLDAREDGTRPAAPLRNEFCEIDMRFGQMGRNKGIFERLDRAGVLDHRVPGVDNIEHAMENPPATGRAKVRGRCIRRLAGERARYVCSWHAIRDRATGKRLDLQDPFADKELWLERPEPAACPSDPLAGLLSEPDVTALLELHEQRHTARRSLMSRRPACRRPRTETTESHDGFRVGDRVILGRHDVVNGSDNWAQQMDRYVGRTAIIMQIGAPDSAGCGVVRVDLDRGRWMWRTRNLQGVPTQPPF